MHADPNFPRGQADAEAAYDKAVAALMKLGIGTGWALDAVDNAIMAHSEYKLREEY